MKPLQTTSVLLRHTWNLFFENRSILLGFSVWILVPYVFILLVENLPVDGSWKTFLIILGYLAQILLSIWAVTSMVLISAAIMAKRRVELLTLGSMAWKRVPALMIVSLLVGTITLGGLFLLVIPGFLFMIWFSFAKLEVVLNNKHGLDALRASYKLVHGRFWQTAWRIVAGNLFLTLCYFFCITLIISLLSRLTGDTTAVFSIDETPLWIEVIISIAEALILPLFVVYYTTIYFELWGTRDLKPQE